MRPPRHPDDLPDDFFTPPPPLVPKKISACMKDARDAAAGRRGSWINTAVKIIQIHNLEIKHEGWCRICCTDAPLVWDAP